MLLLIWNWIYDGGIKKTHSKTTFVTVNQQMFENTPYFGGNSKTTFVTVNHSFIEMLSLIVVHSKTTFVTVNRYRQP